MDLFMNVRYRERIVVREAGMMFQRESEIIVCGDNNAVTSYTHYHDHLGKYLGLVFDKEINYEMDDSASYECNH